MKIKKIFIALLLILFILSFLLIKLLFFNTLCIKENNLIPETDYEKIKSLERKKLLFKLLDNKRCCPGLTAIYIGDMPDKDNQCQTWIVSPGFVCTNCGDKICGKYENKCNCPTDCK